jgi:uncharacterized membrane protein YsdA (DUF1294 family)
VIGRRSRPTAIALVVLGLVVFVVLAVTGLVRPYPAWLIGWSVATFVAYAADKAQARRGGWRIPEIVLHGLAVIGGAAGGWLGLLVLHHKTRHPVFPFVLAVALTVQVAIGIVIGW